MCACCFGLCACTIAKDVHEFVCLCRNLCNVCVVDPWELCCPTWIVLDVGFVYCKCVYVCVFLWEWRNVCKVRKYSHGFIRRIYSYPESIALWQIQQLNSTRVPLSHSHIYTAGWSWSADTWIGNHLKDYIAAEVSNPVLHQGYITPLIWCYQPCQLPWGNTVFHVDSFLFTLFSVLSLTDLCYTQILPHYFSLHYFTYYYLPTFLPIPPGGANGANWGGLFY